MTEDAKLQSVESFEEGDPAQAGDSYVLRLYVTGSTENSVRAVENIKKICEEHLHNRYELEIIDIYQKPNLAAGEQIIAAPTLIKLLPEPLSKMIGDMSNTQKVLLGLDLRSKNDQE